MSARRSSVCASCAVVRVAGDADAGVDLQRDVVELHGLADAGQHVLDDRRQRRHVLGAHGRQDRELIAAESSDQPALADALRQPRPEIRQQVVAVLVPERVVDVLEVVEVDQQHPERSGRLRRPCAISRVDAVVEVLAVGQARELVGGGHAPRAPHRGAGTGAARRPGTGRRPERWQRGAAPGRGGSRWSCKRRPASARAEESSAARIGLNSVSFLNSDTRLSTSS